MDYFGSISMSRLPGAFESTTLIDGVRKQCLVIPCEEAGLRRNRIGVWYLRVVCREKEINPQMITHDILVSRNPTPIEIAEGYMFRKKTANIGRLIMFNDNISLKKDLTNNMTEIECTGRLFFSSIQREDIKTDPVTGKKYIDFVFRKTKELDYMDNSHEIVVKTEDGEYQIAQAKEDPAEKKGGDNPQSASTDSSDNDVVNGYKW